MKRLTNEERIEIAKKIHNNKYIYDNSDFSKVKVITEIICPIHGAFTMDYDHHVHGKNGCPICGGKEKITTEKYIERAKQIHGDKYIYDDIEYISMHDYIYPICPIHGKFKIEAQAHLRGQGCNKCKTSSLEEDFEKLLCDNKISYFRQINKKTFNWLNGLSLDFYIPSKNIAVECQGKQHFGVGGWSKDFNFEEQYNRDKRKFNLCLEHNIKLLYYSNTKPNFEYFDKVYTNKQEIINEIIN